MPKIQTHYICQSCGHDSLRWVGKCPECGEWNSFVEEIQTASKGSDRAIQGVGSMNDPLPITMAESISLQRTSTGIGELDRTMGGGVVPGGVTLVGGDPGIGKSTLLTRVAHKMTSATSKEKQPAVALYVSGEESVRQIKLRAERLGALSDRFLVANETDVDVILSQLGKVKPDIAIIDSIQTTFDSSLESAPGSVSQIRDCASVLIRYAKSSGIPLFLIGHVTKEGALAGPRVLEHMVDTVLYFEGDRHLAYRILRAVKNRFGSTNEIGIFEMAEEGLLEVENPSAALLAERAPDTCGSSVTAILEGARPLLVEIQGLVAHSFLANPRRASTGLDYNRMNMLLAVLEKRLGFKMAEQDVFVNVAGGIRILETAPDLAITMAIASSFRDQPIQKDTIHIGEVGLGGEVRMVSQLEKRLTEAARLGFKCAIIPHHSSLTRLRSIGIQLKPVANVLEAMRESLAATV